MATRPPTDGTYGTAAMKETEGEGEATSREGVSASVSSLAATAYDPGQLHVSLPRHWRRGKAIASAGIRVAYAIGRA